MTMVCCLLRYQHDSVMLVTVGFLAQSPLSRCVGGKLSPRAVRSVLVSSSVHFGARGSLGRREAASSDDDDPISLPVKHVPEA
jgi:hypothetical protein